MGSLRRSALCAFAVCCLLLSGCIGFGITEDGNPIEQTVLKQIETGKTSRAEVLRLLGAPSRIEEANITALAEQALSRYTGEKLTLQIDPALFNDVYVYERSQTDRFILVLGFFNYVSSDTRVDRLTVFFDKHGIVLGVGWTPGREQL